MHRLTKMAAIAAVTALVLSACSSHGKSTGTTSPPAPASSAASTSADASGAGSFGTLGQVCGPGSAKGATDTGVTDSEIHVGTVADVGWSAAPGLLQPIFDGADAFVGWCNAAGGINGR